MIIRMVQISFGLGLGLGLGLGHNVEYLSNILLLQAKEGEDKWREAETFKLVFN